MITENELIGSLHVNQRICYWKLKEKHNLDAFKAGMEHTMKCRPRFQLPKGMIEMSDEAYHYSTGHTAAVVAYEQSILTAASSLKELP